MSRIDHLIKAHKIATTMKAKQPYCAEDLLIGCGLSLKYIESGAFRDVYRINNTGLVVKVPRRDFDETYQHNPVVHSCIEYDYRKKVMKQRRYEFFRPYMPAFHYLCRSTGVMLIDHYNPLPEWETKFDKHILDIRSRLNKLGVTDGDIGIDKKDNYGVDAFGHLRILDLGCFGGELE